jgi:hypothetical protein
LLRKSSERGRGMYKTAKIQKNKDKLKLKRLPTLAKLKIHQIK